MARGGVLRSCFRLRRAECARFGDEAVPWAGLLRPFGTEVRDLIAPSRTAIETARQNGGAPAASKFQLKTAKDLPQIRRGGARGSILIKIAGEQIGRPDIQHQAASEMIGEHL